MSNFEIGIIGGTGGIGKWFVEFFRKEGYTVHVAGRREGMNLEEMARACRVVIVSVPIEATADVIKEVGPLLPKETLFMDFTSLKGEPVRLMVQHSQAEVMGCHPLFGPDTNSIAGQNIVFCPVRVNVWSEWPGELFRKRGAAVIETTPELHDEMMAFVQALNHVNTIMMGLILKETAPVQDELRKFSTPAFDTKLAMIDKIFADNPRLYAEIIIRNPQVESLLARYEERLAEIKELIHKSDIDGLVRRIVRD